MDLTKAIQARRSVRKFKDIKPDWREIIECIDSAKYAPMASGIFTLKFIIVENPEKIKQIAEASQQQFIASAKVLVVACSNPSLTVNSHGERGEIYTHQQAGAAIQNFLLKLQEKKLSTTWVGHFAESLIKETLKIPENVNIEALFPIGYEFKEEKPKARIDLDQILYFEEYGNKRMRKPAIIGKG